MDSIEKKVYDLMDWGGIEGLAYSDLDAPQDVLGVHETEDGSVICAICPGAREAKLLLNGKKIDMYLEDKFGFFATFVKKKKVGVHSFEFTLNNGEVIERGDPYAFDTQINGEDEDLFNKGIHYTIYNKLGAHPMTINGVEGTYFAVWAPNAVRVSVVGEFNKWDGRVYPMKKLRASGIFELFIPGVGKGAIYKYEVKARGDNLTYLKADPYANAAEFRPHTASVVTDISKLQWTDDEWIEKRKKFDYKKEPMSIYEVHLGSWKKPVEKNGSFYNYRDLAVMLADYVKKMGYTHIELLPVMEHPLDASWGYQVTGYYAPTSRYGTPEDFAYFMNYMHEQGIGVILDWVPAHFPKDTFGLAAFDGTCLYENRDPRKGMHPHWGTLIFDYARPEVSNFLIANALFWAKVYHADAIRMDAVASMLYLDYGREAGEWVPNKDGGNENYEAIELLHHLNSVFHKQTDNALVIAEESTAWPNVTKPVDEGGLGFDLKWNMGWMNDFLKYMQQDPLFRKGVHGMLTFSMVYAYSENFILVLSHDEVVHGKSPMIYKMVGKDAEKFANLRLAYGFMTAHPGKKLLFMGNEIAQNREWDEDKSISWNLLDADEHKKIQRYCADLNKLYTGNTAMYELDYDKAGFQWVSSLDADHSIVSFLRRSSDGEVLFVIANFTPVVYKNYRAAVPLPGKYTEIFNSDDVKYGGEGNVNEETVTTRLLPTDGQPYAVKINLCGLGVEIFKYEPAPYMVMEEDDEDINDVVDALGTEKASKKKPAKKAVAKKAAAKKAEPKKAAKKAVAKKAEAKVEAKKAEVKAEEKTVEKKAEPKKAEPKKAEPKKAEPKKAETKKAEPKKAVAKKTVAKKAEAKVEAKKAEAKVEAKKVEVKAEEKPVEKKAETKKAEPKKAETKKAEPKKAETKKAEPKKAEPKKAAAKKSEVKKPAKKAKK
jgi:1,4-alpha-glucan branching enzyme